MKSAAQFSKLAAKRFRKRGAALLCDLYQLGDQTEFVGINFKARACDILKHIDQCTDKKTLLKSVEIMLRDNKRFWKVWKSRDPRTGRPRKKGWTDDLAAEMHSKVRREIKGGTFPYVAFSYASETLASKPLYHHVKFVKNQFNREERKFNEIAAYFDMLEIE